MRNHKQNITGDYCTVRYFKKRIHHNDSGLKTVVNDAVVADIAVVGYINSSFCGLLKRGAAIGRIYTKYIYISINQKKKSFI